MNLESLIEKYCVKNAIKYDGECNPKSVVGKVLEENKQLRDKPKEVNKKVKKIAEQINQLSLKEQQDMASNYEYQEKKEEDDSLPELPNAEEGEVVMRLAPYPSGPLHIGHARMVLLNDEYVKRYNGKLLLVIDDTAGSKEKRPTEKAYDMIPEDLKNLGVEFDEIVYKSDRMDIYYKYGRKFLKKGWAYVCECESEKLREKRRKGEECEHRDQSVEENLEKWEKMLDGTYNEGEAAVRLKTDMKDPDPAFRDRVLLRISEMNHPRVGNEYRVWPMLEFSWAIDDHLLEMTHILRGKDLRMEDKMERYMWDLLGWGQPEILHHGLLNIKGISFSSSKAAKKIRQGTYQDWNDPRTWSIKSLLARGIKPEAIRNFVLDFGLSDNNITVPLKTLYQNNRSVIDQEANRYFFVPDPVKVEIRNLPRDFKAEIPLHPDDPERGNRVIDVKAGKKGTVNLFLPKDDIENGFVRLKHLFNIKLEGKSGVYISQNHEEAVEKEANIVQWLPEESLDCEITMTDNTKKRGKCEKNLKGLKGEKIIQFERFGFCNVKQKENEIKGRYAHK